MDAIMPGKKMEHREEGIKTPGLARYPPVNTRCTYWHSLITAFLHRHGLYNSRFNATTLYTIVSDMHLHITQTYSLKPSLYSFDKLRIFIGGV